MLKRLVRSGPVQAALSALAAAYMWLVARTTRWRIEGLGVAEAAWRSGEGVCVLVWHGRLMLIYGCWPRGAQRPGVLISLSPDGQFIARATETLNGVVIRGSTRRADRAQKKKGGEGAYRRMIEFVRGGGALCVMPDGPRGPRMHAGRGAARLARQTQAPTLCLGVTTKWRIVLNSWDRFVIPLPFGPGAIVWDGPVAPPREGAAPAEVEAVRAELERRLVTVSRRAETLAGVDVIAPADAA